MSPIKRLASIVLFATCLALTPMTLAEDAPSNVKIEFDVKVPEGTPADAKLYVSGSGAALGEWKVDGVKLEKKDDGHYHATVTLPKDKAVEYKINRGSWETVEKGVNGEEVANHTFTPSQDDTVKVEIAQWADTKPAK